MQVMHENSTVTVLLADISQAGKYRLEVKYDREPIDVQPSALFQVVSKWVNMACP